MTTTTIENGLGVDLFLEDLKGINLKELIAYINISNKTDKLLTLIGLKFKNSDLSGSDLHDANFEKSIMRNILFSRAMLSKSSFADSDLHDVDLSGTTLLNVSFKGAVGSNVCFDECDLTGANMRGVQFNTNASAKDPSAYNQNKDSLKVNVSGVSFKDANLSGADFSDAMLIGVDFTGANLEGAIFAGANLSGANLQNAIIKHTDFSWANLHETNTVGTVLEDNAKF